jgi:hypothetical protein
VKSENGAEGNFLEKHEIKRPFEELSWGGGRWEGKNNKFGSTADI